MGRAPQEAQPAPASDTLGGVARGRGKQTHFEIAAARPLEAGSISDYRKSAKMFWLLAFAMLSA